MNHGKAARKLLSSYQNVQLVELPQKIISNVLDGPAQVSGYVWIAAVLCWSICVGRHRSLFSPDPSEADKFGKVSWDAMFRDSRC